MTPTAWAGQFLTPGAAPEVPQLDLTPCPEVPQMDLTSGGISALTHPKPQHLELLQRFQQLDLTPWSCPEGIPAPQPSPVHSPGPRSFFLLLALAAAAPRARAGAVGPRSSCGTTVPFRPGDTSSVPKNILSTGTQGPPAHPKCPQGNPHPLRSSLEGRGG